MAIPFSALHLCLHLNSQNCRSHIFCSKDYYSIPHITGQSPLEMNSGVIFIILNLWFYSCRRESTGLARAARITWKVIVMRAISNANTAARTNVHSEMLIR